MVFSLLKKVGSNLSGNSPESNPANFKSRHKTRETLNTMLEILTPIGENKPQEPMGIQPRDI
jgi:hypothetical protein